MLRAPPLWAEPVTNKELPEGIYYPHARSEELTEEPFLRLLRQDTTGRPVLDVSGNFLEVRKWIIWAN